MATAVAWKPREIKFDHSLKGGIVWGKSKPAFFAKFLFEKIHSEVNKTVGNFLKPASLCQREGERTKEWVKKKKAYKTLTTFTETNKMGHNNNNK